MREPFQRIQPQPVSALERLNVLIGYSATGVVELTTEIIGRWLSISFGEQFVESRNDTANEFGADVFQDALLHECAPHGSLVVAVGMLPGARPGRKCGHPATGVDGAARFFELAGKLKPIRLISHGSLHAYLSQKLGTAQVWLEQLPGSVEFIAAGAKGRPLPGSQACRRTGGGRDAVAWYGLGGSDGDPVEILETVERQLARNSTDGN
jgi:hypothetical protein